MLVTFHSALKYANISYNKRIFAIGHQSEAQHGFHKHSRMEKHLSKKGSPVWITNLDLSKDLCKNATRTRFKALGKHGISACLIRLLQSTSCKETAKVKGQWLLTGLCFEITFFCCALFRPRLKVWAVLAGVLTTVSPISNSPS